MIDLQRETLLSFVAAGRYLASVRGGRPLSPSTLYRWSRRGVRGRTLEVVRIGGRVYTSVEAIRRLAEALTAPPAPDVAPPSNPNSRVTAELDRRGL